MAAVGLIVIGLINVSRWGWLRPRRDVSLAGVSLQPFGLAPTLWVIGLGLLLLFGFWMWSRRRAAHGQRPLVDVSLLRSRPIMAGAATQLTTSLVLAGVLFVIPVFLVVVLGRDPLQAAIALLPLTALLLITAFAALKIPNRVTPQHRVQLGMLLMISGTALLTWRIHGDVRDVELGIALALVGIGIGMTVTQLGGVILPAAGFRLRAEASALKGTARSLGSAMGTGILGSILIVGLTASFLDQIHDIPAITTNEELVAEIEERAGRGIDFLSNDEMRAIVGETELSLAMQNTIVSVNEEARADALQVTFAAATVFACLGLAVSFALPPHRVVELDATKPDILPESW